MSNENRGLGTESIFASGRKVKGITLHYANPTPTAVCVRLNKRSFYSSSDERARQMP